MDPPPDFAMIVHATLLHLPNGIGYPDYDGTKAIGMTTIGAEAIGLTTIVAELTIDPTIVHPKSMNENTTHATDIGIKIAPLDHPLPTTIITIPLPTLATISFIGIVGTPRIPGTPSVHLPIDLATASSLIQRAIRLQEKSNVISREV